MFQLLDYLIQRQCCVDSARRPRASSAIELSRIKWVGPLTVLASITAVLAVRALAIVLIRPDPGFAPLSLTLTIIDTAALVSLGVWVFKRVAAFAVDPVGTYKLIAFKALLLSFLPDIALGLSKLPAAAWPNSFALMSEHVAAWAVCVQMLTRLSRT